MADLPVPPSPVTPLSPPSPPAPGSPVTGGSMNKETEAMPGITFRPEASLPMVDLGREMDLPKEVAAAGVSQKPTVVTVPPPVASLGVQPAGTNVTAGTGTTIVLPLSDEKIEEGLNAGVGSSIRWLAMWCMRQLKRMHIGLRKTGTSWVRVRE